MTRSKATEIGLGNESFGDRGNVIIEKSLLMNAINKMAVCRYCKHSDSSLQLKSVVSSGLAETLVFCCSSCKEETLCDTSRKLESSGRNDRRGGKQSYDKNRRSVLASLPMGYAGLEKFCGVMNLSKPISRPGYNKSMKNIEHASSEVAEKIMNEAAERLIDITSREDGDKIEWDGEQNQKIAEVAVTVDGTWQKRGYSSKTGAVFVMSVRTGEVLDFEVLSLVCFECRAREKKDKDSEEYKAWYNAHQRSCPINHQGSSGDMESKGACKIFLRSVEKRNLKYTVMVGDGDTGCFNAVSVALQNKFREDYHVTKEECVGHVQKRMGTSLREYKKRMRGRKLADGKTVGGAGRLTDKTIDSIQNYYGTAIRRNKGNLEGMRNAILAIYNHMIIDEEAELKEQHALCPQDEDTWCRYWQSTVDNTCTYSETKRLPSVFRAELKPIFNRLSDDALLKRCLLGVTQNQNEALHGVLWGQCPKIKFCGKRKVVIAACQTVSRSNIGASSLADIMKVCSIHPGHHTMRALRKADKDRLKNAAVKISQNYKSRRRYLRAKRLKKKDKAKEVYVSGGYGLTGEPEYQESREGNEKPKSCQQQAKAKKRPKRKIQIVEQAEDIMDHIEPQIMFVMPLQEN